MTTRGMIALLVAALSMQAQDTSFPLESVSVEGTAISRATVLEIAGLRIDALVNKSAIEQACGRLQESGIFPAIDYHYAPGPKHGYVLTLKLMDPGSLSEAAIDIPGIDENEVWQWLASRYPDFNHKVPGDDAAQKFLARQMESHLGAVANWTEIQNGIWELEKPLKRTGYFEATARPERIVHDDQRVLDLAISFYKGPLYYFGELHLAGLSAELETNAVRTWKAKPGDPYDYQYPYDFLQSFFQSVDARQFKKYRVDTKPAPGHVMDVTVAFEPK